MQPIRLRSNRPTLDRLRSNRIRFSGNDFAANPVAGNRSTVVRLRNNRKKIALIGCENLKLHIHCCRFRFTGSDNRQFQNIAHEQLGCDVKGTGRVQNSQDFLIQPHFYFTGQVGENNPDLIARSEISR